MPYYGGDSWEITESFKGMTAWQQIIVHMQRGCKLLHNGTPIYCIATSVILVDWDLRSHSINPVSPAHCFSIICHCALVHTIKASIKSNSC